MASYVHKLVSQSAPLATTFEMAESDHNPFQAPMQRQEQSDPEWDASTEVVERQMRAGTSESFSEQPDLTGEELKAGLRAREVFLR